jgi:hypothetical protein
MNIPYCTYNRSKGLGEQPPCMCLGDSLGKMGVVAQLKATGLLAIPMAFVV